MKKFSIVTIFGNEEREDEEVFLPEFCKIGDLVNSSVVVEILSEISSDETVDVEIEHCYLLERPYNGEEELEGKGYARNMSDGDMDELLDNFDDLLERDMIYCEDTISFELEGLDTDEDYIEEVVVPNEDIEEV